MTYEDFETAVKARADISCRGKFEFVFTPADGTPVTKDFVTITGDDPKLLDKAMLIAAMMIRDTHPKKQAADALIDQYVKEQALI